MNSTTLQMTLHQGDVSTFGMFDVAVVNPAPGGGASASAKFATYLGLAANDLIYNPTTGLLYASVAARAGAPLGNTVVSIDPFTGALGEPIFVGSDPRTLALDDASQTLYVGLVGAAAIRRVDLNTATAGLQFTLGGDSFLGPWHPDDIEILPGSPGTVAVSGSYTGIAPSFTGVQLFDDAVPRPNRIPGHTGPHRIELPSSNLLYGFDGGNFYRYQINASGFTLLGTHSGLMNGLDFDFQGGRLFSNGGRVADPVALTVLGTFAVQGAMAADAAAGRTFFLDGDTFGADPTRVLRAFSNTTFLQLGSVAVPGSVGAPSELVRWGADAIAFRTEGSDQVFVFRLPLVADTSGTPADLSVSITAPTSATPGTSVPFGITVRNNGTATATDVALVNTVPAQMEFESVNPSQGTCTQGAIVRCDLGTLASGASALVTVMAQVFDPGTAVNVAYATAAQFDPNAANNSASAEVDIGSSVIFHRAPVLTALLQNTALADSSGFDLTVTGKHFVSGTTLQWDGAALTTNVLDPETLTATIPAALLENIGSAEITAANPGPGGGVSNALRFAVYRRVPVQSNDLRYDPFTRKLYASVPSTATTNGNTITAIDPLTGDVTTGVFVGSDPASLAISDDGRFLYVGLDGAFKVRRFDLQTQTPGLEFSLGSDFFGSHRAGEMEVLPGNPGAVAVSKVREASPSHAGITIYDDGVPRTNSTPDHTGGNTITFSEDPSILYGFNFETTGFNFFRFAIDANGITKIDDRSRLFDGFATTIEFGRGRVFGSDAHVVNPTPTPPELAATLPVSGPVRPDPVLDRVYVLHRGGFFGSVAGWSVVDTDTYLLLDQFTASGIQEARTPIRWGQDGLAFRTPEHVYVTRGAFVLPPSATDNPVPGITSLGQTSATAGANNLWLVVNGSGFVHGSVAHWDGSARDTVYVSATQLRVAIPAADLATPGTADVTVVNPAPAGGTSNAVGFTIN